MLEKKDLSAMLEIAQENGVDPERIRGISARDHESLMRILWEKIKEKRRELAHESLYEKIGLKYTDPELDGINSLLRTARDAGVEPEKLKETATKFEKFETAGETIKEAEWALFNTILRHAKDGLSEFETWWEKQKNSRKKIEGGTLPAQFKEYGEKVETLIDDIKKSIEYAEHLEILDAHKAADALSKTKYLPLLKSVRQVNEDLKEIILPEEKYGGLDCIMEKVLKAPKIIEDLSAKHEGVIGREELTQIFGDVIFKTAKERALLVGALSKLRDSGVPDTENVPGMKKFNPKEYRKNEPKLRNYITVKDIMSRLTIMGQLPGMFLPKEEFTPALEQKKQLKEGVKK